uniref:hypothetical protein n=1 Tax=Frankia sp. CiP3 TaxID=2880971 RepID=UPI001EF5AAF6
VLIPAAGTTRFGGLQPVSAPPASRQDPKQGFESGCWGRSGVYPIVIDLAEPPAPSTMRAVR